MLRPSALEAESTMLWVTSGAAFRQARNADAAQVGGREGGGQQHAPDLKQTESRQRLESAAPPSENEAPQSSRFASDIWLFATRVANEEADRRAEAAIHLPAWRRLGPKQPT